MGKTPTDQDILEAIARSFLARRGEWPYPRDVAAALGGAVFGLESRLAALLTTGRVGYHCQGARRQVMLLLSPEECGWHRDELAIRALRTWLVNSTHWFDFPTGQRLASEPWRWGDYYAAFLASQRALAAA